MADNRYNQPQGFHGGTPMGPGMMNMTTTVRGTYVQPNMPMNPMMQQQMMMRFPMQGMRMGPPNTPPPPYSAHQPAGVNMANQPRTTLSKAKGVHQKSEKERFFEEQRQKLRQFGRPGAKKVDTDSLIGSMFKVDAKPATQKSKGNTAQNKANADDDGFGDFLQGPALEQIPSSNDSLNTSGDTNSNSNSLADAFEENGEQAKLPAEEKKDLTSMMLECSDLSAPQKAKGFHKPTLNEVHRPKQHDGHRRPSVHHDSDHAISWKSAKDLDGLFQLPPAPVVPTQQPFPVQQQQQMPPGQTTAAITANPAFLPQGQTHAGDNVTLTSAIPNNFGGPQQPFGPPPSGPPPTYGEATASAPESAARPTVNQTPPLSQATPPNSMYAPPSSSPGPMVVTGLPEWCSYDENQIPPVYKQILEASLVDGKIATDRLYPILLLSGLPREKLAHLWSLCNTGTPGLLVKTELWLILALVALTQNNYDTSQVAILARCPVPPIPLFTTGPNAPLATPPPRTNTSQHQQPTPTATPPLAAASMGIASPTTTQQIESQQQQPPSSSDTVHTISPPSVTPPQFQSTPVATTNQASTEDDFADFQTAPAGSQMPATSSLNGKDMQQEDSFGEFIGGASGNIKQRGSYSGFVGASGISVSNIVESDPLDFPPYLPPRNCGTGPRISSSMGNGHIPTCQSAHQASSQQQRNQYHPHHDHQHQHNHERQHQYVSRDGNNPNPGEFGSQQHHVLAAPTQQNMQQFHQYQGSHYHHQDEFYTNDSTDNGAAIRPRQMTDNINNGVPSPFTTSGMPPTLSSVCLEDKYSGNVRSFFCSSDSSTGHTSPSFEDDDFTDGRDSFSQVSTSEQSEVDDIHNFEHYVEEFNHRQKEASDGSPLHCPFPSVPHNSNNAMDKSGQTLKAMAQSAGVKANLNSNTLHKVQIPAPIKASPGAFNSLSNQNGNIETDDFGDFADFKSASSTSTSSTVTTTAATANQPPPSLSADDKYGALRDLTQETDLMQSSVFGDGDASKSGLEDQAVGNDTTVDNKEAEDEEWANFTEAATSSNFSAGGEDFNGTGIQNNNGFLCPPETPNSNSGSGASPQQPPVVADSKEGILKFFQTGSTSTPTLTGEGNSAMVNSDSGYSTRSWGNGKNSDSALTPSSMFDISSPSPSGGDLKGDNTKPDSTTGNGDNSFWSGGQITDSGIAESNWASFGGSHQGTATGSLVQSSSLPVFSMANSDDQNGGEEDWGDFSQTASSNRTLSSLSFGVDSNTNDDSKGSGSDGLINNLGMTNPMPTSTMDIQAFGRSSDVSDWGTMGGVSMLPSSLGQNNNPADDAAMADDGTSNFVTIKKQNLGTNEIMGLFKVRDDPTTMSGYQLPPTQAGSPSSNHSAGMGKVATGHTRRASRRSQGRQMSSDDDMAPPPMDSDGEDDDEHAFSRGYDLDDLHQRAPPVTSYNLFGSTTSSPVYSRAVGKNTLKVKESKEDSGSVNSLELPSATGGGNGGGDSQSTSSLEMVTGGTGSAESKSLDSLDFKTSLEHADEPAREGMQQQPAPPAQVGQPIAQAPNPSPHPIQPQELLASMPKLADKYNIDGMAQGNDRYSYEWERCLEQCSHVLTEANTIFNNISSSAICNEVLKSLQGWEYVSCVIEIYRVSCRVMTAMRSTAISSTESEQTLKEIDLMWNNLSAFLVGASLLPDPSSLVFTDAILKSDQNTSSSPSSACGVCLLNIDMPTTTNTNTSSSTSSSSLLSSLASTSSSSSSTLPSACVGLATTPCINSKLSFAGCNYHSTCANFWVNCVDQTLPSLVLPDLI